MQTRGEGGSKILKIFQTSYVHGPLVTFKFPVKPDGAVVDVALWAASFAVALDVVALLVEQRRAPRLSPVSKSDAGVVSASLVPEQHNEME